MNAPVEQKVSFHPPPDDGGLGTARRVAEVFAGPVTAVRRFGAGRVTRGLPGALQRCGYKDAVKPTTN